MRLRRLKFETLVFGLIITARSFAGARSGSLSVEYGLHREQFTTGRDRRHQCESTLLVHTHCRNLLFTLHIPSSFTTHLIMCVCLVRINTKWTGYAVVANDACLSEERIR